MNQCTNKGPCPLPNGLLRFHRTGNQSRPILKDFLEFSLELSSSSSGSIGGHFLGRHGRRHCDKGSKSIRAGRAGMRLVTSEVVEESMRDIATFFITLSDLRTGAARHLDHQYSITSPHDHSSAKLHEQITPQGLQMTCRTSDTARLCESRVDQRLRSDSH